jgi:hypothetical protein
VKGEKVTLAALLIRTAMADSLFLLPPALLTFVPSNNRYRIFINSANSVLFSMAKHAIYSFLTVFIPSPFAGSNRLGSIKSHYNIF